MKTKSIILAIVLITSFIGCDAQNEKKEANKCNAFDAKIMFLKDLLNIPALSIVIAQRGDVIWSKAYGYSDVENSIEASLNTPFRIASITKTFSSTLIFKQIEKGTLSLDQPLSDFGMQIPAYDVMRVKHLKQMYKTMQSLVGQNKNTDDDVSLLELGIKTSFPKEVLLRHVMSHTAASPLGLNYKYDGNMYGKSGKVLRISSGMSLNELLFQEICEPLKLSNTGYKVEDLKSPGAQPYEYNARTKELKKTKIRTVAAAHFGMWSSANDLSIYAQALLSGQLISEKSLEMAFDPTVSLTGRILPYGLGWFTQVYKGKKIVWHYGWNPPFCSSLLVLIPEDQISLVVLANTDGLSAGYNLNQGDVLNSPIAVPFLSQFVYANNELNLDWNAPKQEIISQVIDMNDTEKDFLTKELLTVWWAQFMANNKVKQSDLIDIYDKMNGSFPSFLPQKEPLLVLKADKDYQSLEEKFMLQNERYIDIYCVGEKDSSGEKICDYGWIKNLDTDETVWIMSIDQATHAGGVNRNIQDYKKIKLQAGNYSVHYKTDDSHSYPNWLAFPPTHHFWGICIWEN